MKMSQKDTNLCVLLKHLLSVQFFETDVILLRDDIRTFFISLFAFRHQKYFHNVVLFQKNPGYCTDVLCT